MLLFNNDGAIKSTSRSGGSLLLYFVPVAGVQISNILMRGARLEGPSNNHKEKGKRGKEGAAKC